MLARFNNVVPKGTSVLILQPGGNDARKGKSDTVENVSAIQSRADARGIRVIMLDNGSFRGLPRHMMAESLAGQVAGAPAIRSRADKVPRSPRRSALHLVEQSWS